MVLEILKVVLLPVVISAIAYIVVRRTEKRNAPKLIDPAPALDWFKPTPTIEQAD
jgi:hypothetical protein